MQPGSPFNDRGATPVTFTSMISWILWKSSTVKCRPKIIPCVFSLRASKIEKESYDIMMILFSIIITSNSEVNRAIHPSIEAAYHKFDQS